MKDPCNVIHFKYLSDDPVEGFGGQHSHVLGGVLDEGPTGRHVLRHYDVLDLPVTAEYFSQHLLEVSVLSNVTSLLHFAAFAMKTTSKMRIFLSKK